MDSEDTGMLLNLMGEIAASLALIARHTAPEAPEAPDFQRPLDQYATFDWESLDATVVRADECGPALVEWGGRLWLRRAPENKFGAAIWYSRAAGKDAEGKNRYLRLITFREIGEADPISRTAERALRGAAGERGSGAPLPATVTEGAAAQMAFAAGKMGAGAQNAPPAPAGTATAAATGHAAAAESDREFGALEGRTQPAAGRTGALAEAAPQPQPPTASDVALLCPNCGQSYLKANAVCPRHVAPGIQPPKPAPAGNGKARQALLGTGKVGGEFRNWAADFVRRYPRYKIRGSDDADLYHLLKTVGSFGILHIDTENLAAVQAQLEAHAQRETL